MRQSNHLLIKVMAVGICEKTDWFFKKKTSIFSKIERLPFSSPKFENWIFYQKLKRSVNQKKPIGFQFFVSKFHKLKFTLVFNRFYWFLKNQSRPILHPNHFFNACSNPRMNLNKKTTEMNRSLKIKGKCSKHQHFPSPTLVPLRDGAWRQTSGTCRVAATPKVEGHHPPRL
jgi:hypothetical protein